MTRRRAFGSEHDGVNDFDERAERNDALPRNTEPVASHGERVAVRHGPALVRARWPRLDRKALRELILRFALLRQAIPEIVEADLKPVRCTPDGCVVLGMRLRIDPLRYFKPVKTW